MRISDWSSDVCSSDLHSDRRDDRGVAAILLDQQRHPHRGEHHGEGGEGVAHHHREERHAEPEGERRAEQAALGDRRDARRSEEHTSELQSLMRISYAVFCLKKKKQQHKQYYSKSTTEQ